MATKKPTKKRSNIQPPSPPSRSGEEQRMYSRLYDIPEKLDNETRRMRAQRIQNSTHRGAQTAKNMKAQGTKLYGYRNSVEMKRDRAGNRTTQPAPKTRIYQTKDNPARKASPSRTPTALPPRSGASSGGGSSMYNRLTGGGLPKHGR